MMAALRFHHRTASSPVRFAEATCTTLGCRANSKQLLGSQIPSAAWLISLLLLSYSPVFIALADAQARLMVEWKGGRLSVSAERAPLAQVLREVARRTGVEIQGIDGLQESVSVRFSDLPLRVGLEKLIPEAGSNLLTRLSC
jgi:hypothetical protein